MSRKSKDDVVEFDTTSAESQPQNSVEQSSDGTWPVGDVAVDEPTQGVDTDVDFGEEVDEVDTPATDSKPAAAKAEKAPARPPVPEGYITPVQFAKELTDHLEKQGASNKKGPINKTNPIPPQMVYSYLKSNGAGSKNPLNTYSEGGRDNLLKLEEALAWWDAKAERGAERARAAEQKAQKQAEKASTGETEAAPVEAEAVEAE